MLVIMRRPRPRTRGRCENEIYFPFRTSGKLKMASRTEVDEIDRDLDGTEMVCPRRAILREFRTVRRWTEKPTE
jgi:hypothetical protein